MKTTKVNFELPLDYVITKFYELGYKVSYNHYDKTYRSCCPICREGKSWGRKKRCYFIPENDNIFCHNCGSSLKPFQWIKEVSGMTDEEIAEDAREAFTTIVDEPTVKEVKPHTLPDDSINLFDQIQLNYYKNNSVVRTALKIIDERRLKTAVSAPDALYVSLKDKVHKNRLIIPFKDSNGKIIFYQSRKMFVEDEKTSYISKQGADKSICGMEHIDPTMDHIFIFEGPIDSYFVKNGVAVAGINKGYHRFTAIQSAQLDELKLFKKIWVLDSQWIDETSREKTLKLLELGECVFFWPKKWGQYKDFNEICVKHGLDQISPEFIKKNSYCGQSAIVKFKVMFSKL